MTRISDTTTMTPSNGRNSRPRHSRPLRATSSRNDRFLVLFTFLCLQVLGLVPFAVTAFAATVDRKSTTKSSTKLRATLSWSGDATASLELDNNDNAAQGLSIRDWLDDPAASNIPLLGTDDVERNRDGNFVCRQPPIDFLGVALQPVFVNKISRSRPGCATVSILDAKTNVKGGPGGSRTSMAGSAIQSLMQDSQFQGRSVIQANDSSNRLTVDLNLTLNVKLPPFMLLPPGFNSMGSSIMKRAGKARSRELLKDLQRDYQQWVAKKMAVSSGNRSLSIIIARVVQSNNSSLEKVSSCLRCK